MFNALLEDGKKIFLTDVNNIFMKRAKEIARTSTDRQQSVGAVIVCDGKIIAEDSNRIRFNFKWLINLHKNFCIRHLLGVPSGKHYWICPGCIPAEMHAESRASKKILKSKISCGKGLEIYTWGHWICCDVCAKNMKKAKIERFFFLENSEKLFNPKSEDNILGKQFD